KKIKSFAASTNYLGEYELTPELRRNYEKQYGIDSGNDWRTIVIKNSGDELIGLTEVYVVNNGTIAFQELTGILPQYRRKGLARWIKNQMLIDIKQVYPDLQEIFTRNYIGNTNSGEAVLAMNQSIGYNPIKYDYQYKTRYIID
ncbi:MAG: hypothetical protein OEZ01_10735, partial [Candidatus Heimdallarchaeota archaeon]|nr:hypothetical protein [Candidatus Heimdallarchaeota archaeon]